MLRFILLISLLTFKISNAQGFEKLFEIIEIKHEKETLKLQELDSVISICPDISKYPELLFFKSQLYFEIENYSLDIKYLLEASKHAKEYTLKYDILHNLGNSYAIIDKFESSKKAHQDAFMIAKKNNDTLLMEISKESLFLLRIEQEDGNIEDIKKYEEFILSRKHNIDALSKIESFVAIQDCYLKKKAYDMAEAFSNKITIDKEYDLYPLNLSDYLGNRAEIEIHKKNYNKALYYLDQIRLDKITINTNKIQTYKIYKKVHALKGDQIKSNQYNNYIISVLEKNIKEINTTNIDTYESLDQKISETKQQTSLYKILLISTIAFLTIVMIFSLVKTTKEEKKTKTLNSELALTKGKYSKTLQNTISFKKEVKRHLKEKNLDELNKVQKQYEIEDTNAEINIKALISEIKPSFFNRLNTYNLTLNDMEKLLIFYKTKKHTNKEIATITNRSLRSIQSFSYRLNKKTLATLEINLATFIENLK